ncbi:hypothetical protein AK812_SmicGene46302, partial [Symbiodinium microadriaticum]
MKRSDVSGLATTCTGEVQLRTGYAMHSLDLCRSFPGYTQVRRPAAPPKAGPEVPPAPPKFATAGYSSTSQETTAAVAKSPSIAAAESRLSKG